MRIIKRPLARFDLIEEADFIEQVYGLEKANTFLDSAVFTSGRNGALLPDAVQRYDDEDYD